MTEKKRRPIKKRGRPVQQSPYFLQPARQGQVTVLRRPAGNRIDPKLCGTMNSRALALALVKQLERAESVVKDLFLEATDDGIEALEAVLEACRHSVVQRGEAIERASAAREQSAAGKPRGSKPRRGRRRVGGARTGESPSAPPPASAGSAEDTSAS